MAHRRMMEHPRYDEESDDMNRHQMMLFKNRVAPLPVKSRFEFRGVPARSLDADSLKGPMLFFDPRRDKERDDEESRSLEGKATDFALSVPVQPGSKVAFYSHTRRGLRIQEKTAALLKKVHELSFTHVWIDACCFPQLRIIEEKLSIGFDDLRMAIEGSHELLVDLTQNYSEQLWCIVEWIVWDALKRESPAIILDGSDDNLIASMQKRDHKAWMEEQLGKLDEKGKGDEMRQIIRGAEGVGIDFFDRHQILSRMEQIRDRRHAPERRRPRGYHPGDMH